MRTPICTSFARSIRAWSGSFARPRRASPISPTWNRARLGIQLAFGLMYTVIALTVLLAAAWLGLNFANRLVSPIRRLIGAANLVSTGNLHVQVPIRRIRGRPGATSPKPSTR